MTDSNPNNNQPPQTPDASEVDIPVGEMDAASRSLSEALGVSFVILKVIMAIVLVAFLASGFKTVGPGEQAIVLRFGKLHEINNTPGADPYVRGAGLIWTFPYPIDEVIRIPVKETVPFEIRSFWYFQTPDEILGTGPRRTPYVSPKLNAVTDGYSLVRGAGLQDLLGSAAGGDGAENNGSDYNLVHSKWQVVYEIADISRFFRNVLVDDPQPGEVYFELIKKSVTPIIKSMVEDAVVDVLVNYSIDEVIVSSDRIPRAITQVAQRKLDTIESGIRLVSVTANDVQVPRQVEEAFNALHNATQEREVKIKEAEQYKRTTLTAAAGAVAEELVAAVENARTPSAELERLWAQATGKVSTKTTEAETYRSRVVERAKANARTFKALLAQYRERPQLLVDNLYLDVIPSVLNMADEKIVIQPGQGKDREVRIHINRDASLKSQQDKPAMIDF